ncbi:MAG: alanine--tRNA ligase [Nanohaloarchaea archaeon]|nr:alanine--tRNA ligase [Candidatus Nanohaloarchaea archaeon]
MKGLEQLKKEIKEEASDNPEKFFATDVLREKGFSRAECENCGMYFWSADEERNVCGEPECSGGYTFINDSPSEKNLNYVETWKEFSGFMEERGYHSIPRYPTIARWRDDEEFTGASIYCFQPYVVSGEAEPPAPELVIPQPCLRFNDVDNVGITGRHYTNFIMVGQACFQPPENYDQDRYFRDMFEYVTESLQIPEEKLVLHEDSWGGGGNLGASMEFFVDGLELFNQVYMFYEITHNGYEELDQRVLDMGMGQNRITWIMNGTETSYESVMHETVKKMKERTGLEVNQEVWQKFLPHSSELNVDEVEDIDDKWREIASEIEEDVDELKEYIKPSAALYSIADHTRALLFALADGKLPSNTGGGHNLRMIFRRSMDFIEKYDWDLELTEVAEWHAEELKPLFPELEEKLPEVKEIIEVEKEKYEKSRTNAVKRLKKINDQPSVEEMVELYESHGVSPEMMEEHGFEVPEDFYSRIASEDEQVKQEEEKFDLSDVEKTELLFYKNEKQREFEAEIIGERNKWIILDRTCFYPEGGGQDPDHGTLKVEDGEFEVTDVQKQDNIVLHKVSRNSEGGLPKVGQTVKGVIDWDRRLQLMQHHTSTHLVNGAAKSVLGDHIWQAGAHKTIEKGRLDVTHYEKLSRDKLDEIEEEVRETIMGDLNVEKQVLEKSVAEEKYGFRIYQGGAPPGNEVRIVTIKDGDEIFDVEACGGTHLESASEADWFVVTGSTKVQDGVIRLNYKAGEAAQSYVQKVEDRVERIAERLGAKEHSDFREVQRELETVFSVEPDQLENTVDNFLEDLDSLETKIRKLERYLETDTELETLEGETIVERANSVFEVRKEREKQLEELESELESYVHQLMEDRRVEEEVPTSNVGLLIQIARKLAKKESASVTLLGEKGAVSASYHEDFDADENLEKYSENVQGDENFAKAFDI